MDGLTGAQVKAPLPPELPLAMPAQSFRGFDRKSRDVTGRPGRGGYRMRFLLAVTSITLTTLLTREMWQVLALGEMNAIEWAMLALFVLNIGWISFGSCSSLLGLFRARWPKIDPAVKTPRTALLIPIYNENPARVVATASATLKALKAADEAADIDAFLLSDTNQLSIWLSEQALVDAARKEPLAAKHLFYRHRLRNRERKSGNIRDWIERWGGAYDAFIVLDADSLMEPETILTLMRRMAADERAGIIQSAPRLVGGETPLGRLQQFSTRVYGRLNARGLSRWFGDVGNYWGHNAIIRTAVFAKAAGLPVLPGAAPFGGPILSHDFVEAALVRRAGYSVRMAEDLQGSFEQAPPNMIELASRDRRWCQGNLQHLRLIFASGIHPVSRLHFAMGAFSYLASPIWLLFLIAGMALAIYAYAVPPDYFADPWALFPTWPRINSERAIALFGICMGVLFLPKLVGLISFLIGPHSRGMRVMAIPGVIVEVILTGLMAPVMMMMQTRAIIEILIGLDSGWNMQTRDAARVRWRTLWRFQRLWMFCGLLTTAVAAAISWSLLAWMSPALIGLCLCIPVTAFLGSARAGAMLRRFGLLVTPEELRPPEIAGQVTEEAAALLRQMPMHSTDLPGLLATPDARQRHQDWLDERTERQPGEADDHLAQALLKFADGLGPSSLSDREAYAVASSPDAFTKLAG